MSAENLILSPLITEKGTAVGEEGNQVVFRVRPEASKDAIRDVVERMFKVTRAQGADAQGARQKAPPRTDRRRAFGLEKGLRDAERGRPDRIFRGRLGRPGDIGSRVILRWQ